MPQATGSSFHRFLAALTLTVGLMQVAQPVWAQSFGDAFTSAAVGSQYPREPVTKRVRRMKPEPLLNFSQWKKAPSRLDTFDGSLGAIPDGEDPFAYPPDELPLPEYGPVNGDPFSQTAFLEQCPADGITLMGATHGTIGPQDDDENRFCDRFYSSGILPGGDPAIIKRKTLKASVSIRDSAPKVVAASPMRQTLHDIWDVECEFQPFGNLPTPHQMSELKRLYTKAATLESHPVMKTYYRFMAQMAVENLDGAWIEAERAAKQSPLNSDLFESFAEEFDYIGKHDDADFVRDVDLMNTVHPRLLRGRFLSAFHSLRASNWQRAWSELESIYTVAPEAAKFQNKVAQEYSLVCRDAETCVWLTRYLKVAPDWMSFESAYDHRTSIELNAYVKELDKEPKIVGHWNASRLPLKICFSSRESGGHSAAKDWDLQLAMQEALIDWMFVAPGKLDYVLVEDEKLADVVCTVEKRVDQYTNYLKPGALKEIPVALHGPPAAAETYTTRVGEEIRSARIVFYEDGFARTPSALKELSLHESGHMLGLLHHSKDSSDIMYGIKMGPDKNELTRSDRSRLSALYKNHPLNAVAVEHFLGLRAICHRLGENL